MQRSSTNPQWCDLPKELWQIIGKFLDSRVDVLRFRSVCTLWRSAVPSLTPTAAPPLPLRYPDSTAEPPAIVFQNTVYVIQSLISGDDSDESQPCLVKLEESSSGEMRLLHPLTNWQVRNFITPTIKEFNLLDFRVVELVKLYCLKYAYTRIDVTYVNKVVVIPTSPLDLGEEFVVFMIYKGGHLGCMRNGDLSWTCVDENNSHYDDLIVYKGQCYVVDKWGTISWINEAMKLVQYSPPLCGFGGHKHLVECSGDLYVVDRYIGDDRSLPQRTLNYVHCDGEAVDFKVYRLDEEWGTWINVTNLGDQVIILGSDGSFSVSARDFRGVKGNCIMFTEQDFGPLPAAIGERSRSRHCRVFDLEDGSMSNIGCSPLFRTPSSWLSLN